jgi:hypothetical protein
MEHNTCHGVDGMRGTYYFGSRSFYGAVNGTTYGDMLKNWLKPQVTKVGTAETM